MGTDIYDIDAPSAMLSGPMVSGLGAAGPFAGAQGLPIQAGAINPAAAGLLAPKATGFSPGTIEGAQAQLATLKGGKPAWSGEGYQDWKVKQLEDFLAGAQSQGGLVSGPGAFTRRFRPSRHLRSSSLSSKSPGWLRPPRLALHWPRSARQVRARMTGARSSTTRRPVMTGTLTMPNCLRMLALTQRTP